MTFTEQKPSFESPLYNPSFYIQEGDALTLESAQLLFLPKTDLRLSYLNGIIAGVGGAGSVLCLDSNRSISNINDISCSSINGSSTSGLAYVNSVTAGFASAGKALVIDNNRDISGIKKISTSHVSGYTSFESNQGSSDEFVIYKFSRYH